MISHRLLTDSLNILEGTFWSSYDPPDLEASAALTPATLRDPESFGQAGDPPSDLRRQMWLPAGTVVLRDL